MEEKIDVDKINFHPVLKDIENMFYFFMLSIRTLCDEEILSLLHWKNFTQPGYGQFNKMLNKFNITTSYQVKRDGDIITSKRNVLKEMVFTGKAMAILTFDFLSFSNYYNSINKDYEFQFLRHIRNGAAHNNKFNLKDQSGNWKIREDEVVEWKDKKISRSIHGAEVFNNFMSLFDIFLLANHFSEKLKGIDSSI
jgi:hypothetical protein